jgi:hypothetical protein
MNFREHIIDIDGIKVSTRTAGFDEIVMSVMKGAKREENT